MLERIINYSVQHKLIILLFSAFIVGFGSYSLTQLPIGAVPDVTNNQVQIITTSRNLATEDVEKFLTYPVELEMANLPDVKEIRSISKFGLSVVTVVFEDRLGTYLPRQLIAEKIKSAEEKIPAGFGKPFMGPITTGLGEIYQYVLDVDSAHKNDYSLSDLRTMQDWIVKRQLSGISGVVEVNTWGGYLKQYEVAIDPTRLKSLNISLQQVYDAVSNNNSVAGGGYIEKTNQTFFIRGEGLATSLEDVANIVVETKNGIPVYVKDIGTVGFGHATRFGAVTGNGEGEKVLGQVMMLKDANSKQVISDVKERVSQIQDALPAGVSINPFLERSELIEKTTFTISENLILGCLIVVFVVVLLLGNLRSGLVVASVIPMTLLFALSMMYLFKVDANLMSLGAIDFGIIIDGAVIIVEFIAFQITSERSKIMSLVPGERQSFIDKITQKGASKMMHSAVFGQLIIIIVFIPILSLVGVEGKMFKPMALVFCFALLGAMLLCFTYVPVMASLFIRPAKSDKQTISKRLIASIEKAYLPTINWALRKKKLVVGSAAILLIATIGLFTTMGGEFVPTLDEGDFVIQPILKTGTSLSKTVELSTQMEQILMQFPEVDQVVTRIGAAEVPTDPMSMEEGDVMIKLKPKNQWVTAETKDDLANQFKEALQVLPGVEYEFTQPIEMRFNELITGVRADVAIKIFGSDLDILQKKALEVEGLIQDVEGASDISVEKIAGLPQMSVVYNRSKIAKYGLNISELNNLIAMGFAGLPAGTVFEGEKQFDLVLRYDKDHHQNIDDIANASVQLPNGNSLPLREFATVEYTKGPAKISRDNTKRRVVVGVNVRNRDLESVVTDIQGILNQQLELPVGYTIEYGGQFENLRTAKQRLMIAVPIALILIFVLLYFAFSSVKEALLIYSAIPMSAIGGVILLYLRGLPFSISAGVGFIALFGIAVLNGIVLIEEFKDLKNKGIMDINERIRTATKNRIRPVLLTASAAALGFLPMAISTSAGAEVQRPLATVVVGGLISATLLTLVVLPVLYALFDSRKSNQVASPAINMLVLGGVFLFSQSASAQTTLSADQAVELALKNNLKLKSARLEVSQRESLTGTAIDIDKTQVYYNNDQNNIAPNNIPLQVIGVSQSIKLPQVYQSQKNVLKANVDLAKHQEKMVERNVTKYVLQAYQEVVYWKQMEASISYLDSMYAIFETAANTRFAHGESNALERLTAITKRKEIGLQLSQVREKLDNSYRSLNQWVQTDSLFLIKDDELTKLAVNGLDTTNHPGVKYYAEATAMSVEQFRLEKQKLLPEIDVAAFEGRNNGPGVQSYSGFQVGIGIPLFFGSQKAKIDAAKIHTSQMETQREDYTFQLLNNYAMLRSQLASYEKTLAYYETDGNKMQQELLNHAQIAFQNGEIDFLKYIQLLDHTTTIETNYLSALYQYNITVLEANFMQN